MVPLKQITKKDSETVMVKWTDRKLYDAVILTTGKVVNNQQSREVYFLTINEFE